MSVLPQLERELLAAHARWRRRRPQLNLRGAVAVLAGVAVVVAVVVVIATAGHRPTAVTVRTATTPPGAVVLVRNVKAQVLFVGGGSLYLGQSTTTGTNLVHRDSASGQVICVVGFPGQVEHVLPAYGALWVTTAGRGLPQLWKIDPNSGDLLAPTVTLPGSGDYEGDLGSLASAGGSIWVGTGDDLIRVAPDKGAIRAVIRVPGAKGIQVASDGRHLVVGDARASARLELRDPRTGALLAASSGFPAGLLVALGGIADGGVWVSVGEGPSGYVERIALPTMQPAQGAAVVSGTGALRVQVFGGIPWVTEPDGGPERNYCADPVTGRPRAPLALPRGAALATGDGWAIYYTLHRNLVRAPIDPRCR
jgi:hypothetical protein